MVPSTATPTTAVPTAAPTQAQNSTYTGETRISGDDWATAIAKNRNGVIAAAEEFLRNALPDASVMVTNVAAGSLIISYEVVSKYRASGVEGLIRQAPLTSLQTSYRALSGSTGSLTLLSTGSKQPTDQKACTSACVAMVVIGVIVIITIVIVICIICKKKPNNNSNNDPSKQPDQYEQGGQQMAPRSAVPARQYEKAIQVVTSNPLPSQLQRHVNPALPPLQSLGATPQLHQQTAAQSVDEDIQTSRSLRDVWNARNPAATCTAGPTLPGRIGVERE